MPNKTIAYVKPQTREWNGPNGTIVFVSGGFDDGDGWSVGCKPDNVQQRIQEFEALINKPGEFELEAGKEFQGKPQWKLKSWPGKPSFGGGSGGGFKSGGGGKTWTEAYAQSKECKELEQRSIQRSVALEKAHQFHVAFAGLSSDPVTPQTILATADIYAAWLSKQPDTSGEYRSWVTWMEQKVKAKVFTSKEDAWKAAMTYANEMGYDHPRLKTCTDHSIFRKIEDKLEAPTRPANGNTQQPNAYQRQPVEAYGNQDDALPF